MISIRQAIALMFVAAAAPAALLVASAPAEARKGGGGKWVEVGPIWNQQDAEKQCPKAARRQGGTWTGQWKTTVQGQMSKCQIKSGSSHGRKRWSRSGRSGTRPTPRGNARRPRARPAATGPASGAPRSARAHVGVRSQR